ncbi:MAG: hypothetical protein A2Z18_10450 [Armatimonadetes bacterium RBG_16_58_9]|nr:MAG: hypothetical protein A2Z18_10450 [Armatimonadetes bacterium RBG_16_58_9]
MVPLSIIWSRKPVTRVERGRSIDELPDADQRRKVRTRIDRPLSSWRNFFVVADALARAVKWFEENGYVKDRV